MIRATLIGDIEEGKVLFEKLEDEKDIEDDECKQPGLNST
jgi:hypothetical protein